jgi:hypothetical protein
VVLRNSFEIGIETVCELAELKLFSYEQIYFEVSQKLLKIIKTLSSPTESTDVILENQK